MNLWIKTCHNSEATNKCVTICKCRLNNKLLNAKTLNNLSKHLHIYSCELGYTFMLLYSFLYISNTIFVYQLKINVCITGNILGQTATNQWLEITGIRETIFWENDWISKGHSNTERGRINISLSFTHTQTYANTLWNKQTHIQSSDTLSRVQSVHPISVGRMREKRIEKETKAEKEDVKPLLRSFVSVEP